VKTDNIIIRPGRKEDRADIWRLLHCEGKAAKEELSSEGCFVLIKGEKMLGVFIGESDVAVHPLYSQVLVEDILVKSVTGLLDTACSKRQMRGEN